jgi:carboxymethylenebutenolidase
MEKEIRIETPSGSMRTFIAHPDGDGPYPVGLILMDAPGYREALRDIARRYAAAGYFVVVPDMYHAFGDEITIDINKARAEGMQGEEGQRMFGYVRGLTPQLAASFTRAILDHLPAEPAAIVGPAVCLGFCMGARHMLHTLATFPAMFVAGSGIHPPPLVREGEDSPHLELADVRGAVYLGFAERDAASEPEQLAALQDEATRHDVRLRMEVYPDTDHGFAMADTAVYSEAGAERHFARTLELWGDQRSAAGHTMR